MKLKVALILAGLCLSFTSASAQFSSRCPTGANPTGMAFDTNHNLWVANWSSNSVTRFNGSLNNASCPTTSTFAVGVNPVWLAVDSINQTIWVSNYGSNSVTELSTTTGAVIGTYAVGAGPRVLVWDGSSIWVANSLSNTVTRLDASPAGHGRLLGTFSSGGSAPYFVAYDGKNIWVANEGSNTVTQLSDQQPTVGMLLSTTFVPNQPVDLAWDGQNIWVTCYSAGAVVKIQGSTASVVGTFTANVPAGPSAIIFDGSSIWVGGYAGNAVLRMDAATGEGIQLFPVNVNPFNPYGMAVDGIPPTAPVVHISGYNANSVITFIPQ